MAVLKVESGDVFAIPTKKGDSAGFLLGRVIDRQQVAIVEVFDKFIDDFQFNADKLSSIIFSEKDRLFPPIMVIFLFDAFSGKVKWPLLGKSMDFDVEKVKGEITFLTPEYRENGCYIKGSLKKQDPPGRRNRVAEDATMWQVNQLVFRTRFYMDGTFEKGSVFDYSSVAGDLHKKGELKALMDEAIAISDAVASKLKSASRR